MPHKLSKSKIRTGEIAKHREYVCGLGVIERMSDLLDHFVTYAEHIQICSEPAPRRMAIPSIYRLYSLAVIYRCDLQTIVSCYGVDVEISLADLETATPTRSHLTNTLTKPQTVQMPVHLDPAYTPKAVSCDNAIPVL